MTIERPDRVRRTVLYSGRVQGVGFRFTTRTTAARFAVTGIVRNLPDGRVELVMEGEPTELDRFQQAVVEVLGRYIRDISSVAATATGEFSSFEIVP